MRRGEIGGGSQPGRNTGGRQLMMLNLSLAFSGEHLDAAPDTTTDPRDTQTSQSALRSEYERRENLQEIQSSPAFGLAEETEETQNMDGRIGRNAKWSWLLSEEKMKMTCTLAWAILGITLSLPAGFLFFIAGWRGAAVYPNDAINFCSVITVGR